MTETVDVIVVGAGVVGLATARALARSGREVVIVERETTIGSQTSSRNSEVIHAGIPYRPSGLRGRLVVPGRDALYGFCDTRGVPHRRCGKLIVAIGKEEQAKLAALKATAEQNGVDDLEIISGEAARALEPAIECDAALVSPSSGIVDSHGLMNALLGDFEAAGGVIAFTSDVVSGAIGESGIDLVFGGAESGRVRARLVVNCAGLGAPRLAAAIDGVPPGSIPKLYYGKGQYFSYAGKAPFSRLIYPMPREDSLGVHYTCDLGGQAKFGPDITFVENDDDYSVDESRRDAFAQEIRRFWPALDEARLAPAYAGIRPKLAGLREEGDYLIAGPADHGAPGYMGLYGIESPGLTSCLAIADYVVEILAQ
ncbi:MAG: NAD(P)/FAD-dependent oxidoreductase [Pseudomonadota bacterium]